MIRNLVLLLAVLVAPTMSACGRLTPALGATPTEDWATTLRSARQAADSGRWGTAERRLADYAARHPNTAEAYETLYWRGVFRLAPGNDSAVYRMGLPALEEYLARGSGVHRTEARVLLALANDRVTFQRQADAREREVAQVRAALGRAQETRSSPGGGATAPDRGLGDEVERLKGELARATQELERIRRRLAGQRP